MSFIRTRPFLMILSVTYIVSRMLYPVKVTTVTSDVTYVIIAKI